MSVKLLIFDSYLAAIRNSLGANIFRNLWAKVDGRKKDILEDGDLSCATFVSAILLWFDLIKERHATVSGTLKDMKRAGWQKIKKPKIGAVLHWEKAFIDNAWNEHIGFYIGTGKAISNNFKKKVPILHHWTYGSKNNKPKRRVLAIYWHPLLNHSN